MKQSVSLIFSLVIMTLTHYYAQSYKNGDIIFIKNKEIKGKTLVPNGKSDYNYIGVVFIENDTPIVYHSTQPFSKCSLKEFIGFSENGDFEKKCLVNKKMLTNEILAAMHGYATARLGSAYDNSLKLNNDQLYNAEFVWKLYEAVPHLVLCIPRQISDYRSVDTALLDFLSESYGESILSEKIVSVGDIYQSQFLE